MAQEAKPELGSTTADNLLIAGLFLPFLPIITTLYFYILSLGYGCSAESGQSCNFAGLDLNALYALSASILAWAASAGAGACLLVHILLLAALAQFTTQGFRGRVVRTCAVVMWAGILPLAVGLAAAISRSYDMACQDGDCGAGSVVFMISHYGHLLFDWLANVAVPLAVMVTGLLALTLGYRLLIGRIVQLAARQN